MSQLHKTPISSPEISKESSQNNIDNSQSSLSSSSSSSTHDDSFISSLPLASPKLLLTSSPFFPSSKQTPFTNKNTLPCFALNLLDRHGKIYPLQKRDCLYLLKIQKVNIEDNFNELYEQGKRNGNHPHRSIPDISFWYQRYYLYSKYDQGIQMDYESWYSVTPEVIAKYIAEISKDKTIIDGFCGSGGNVIQFSKSGKKVFAIDIDMNKLQICRNNCTVYNCGSNIEYILSDYLVMRGKICADYVFLSPPWGGVKYKDVDTYSIKKLMTPNVMDILRVSLSIAKNVWFYLPRNWDIDEWMELVKTVKKELEPGAEKELCFDVRILHSNGKIKALLIIFGYNTTYDNWVNDWDLKEYLQFHYKIDEEEDINYVVRFSKLIGVFTFLSHELRYRGGVEKGSDIKKMINYFVENVMNERELARLKAWTVRKYAKEMNLKSLGKVA